MTAPETPLPNQDAVIVALGSNVGDSHRTLEEVIQELRSWSGPGFRASSLWKSEPVDCPPGSASFLNAVVLLDLPAGGSPDGLLAKLQLLEKEYGRKTSAVPNAPRPLDLDIISWKTVVSENPVLTLPHPRAHLRLFVLSPLMELAPDLVLPGQDKTIRQLSMDLEGSEQSVERLSQAGNS